MPRFLRLVLLMSCICFFALSSQATNYYTYTSAATNGFWNVAGTWTTDPSGVSLTGSAVPGNNDVVTILNGFTVNLNANVATTGLSITINNGGTLNLSTYTMATIATLSGSGTLRLQSINYPTITTNNFLASYASGATVEYYDFSGTLPVSINYPNLRVSNSTSTPYALAFSNSSAYALTIFGNLATQATGTGTLALNLGVAPNTSIITVTVNGNVSIGSNTTLGVGVVNAIHVISLYGNLTNNGTVDLSNGAIGTASTTGAAHVTFRGATDNTVACNGLTDFYTLTLDKGSSSTNILSVTSTNTANLNFYSNGELIHLDKGTIRLGNNINIPKLFGSGTGVYEVGDATLRPMFWVDGATVHANGSAIAVYGKFRITAGSFTTGNGEGSVIRFEGQYIIEGGTFTTSKFRPSTDPGIHRGSFTMSGGTFTAQGTGSNAGYARFSLPFPDQVFIMSGGTINVGNPESAAATNGGIHIGCNPANYNVTGGTFNATLSGSATSFNILSTAPFYDLNIFRTGGPTAVKLATISSVGVTTVQPLVVLNNLAIDGVNTPILDAAGLNVTVGGNFTINTGATYTPGTNTTTFNGSADQAFNSGMATTSLSNMTMNKPGGTLTLGGATSAFTVTQSLTLTAGILNDGGKTIQANGNIHNQATHTGTGSITLGGTSTQILSGNGTGIYGNLTLNNTIVPGARATADLTVSGILTLAGTGNSLFDINQYTLSLTSTSATALATAGNGFSSAKMIRTLGFQSDGGIRKTFGNLTAFKYEFGVGTNYTPATIQLTTAPTTYGTVAVKPVATRNPFVVVGNTNNLTWYWRTVSAGFVGATTVSHTYRYVDTSVSPAPDDANYVPARYDPTTWTVINDLTQVDQATNDIFFTNVSYLDGEFTAGVSSAFGIVKVFYSKRNGNWTDTGAGTTPWSNTSHSGPDATTIPTAGDHVYIGDGSTFNHTITIIANGASSGGMEINAGSTLNVGTFTGHNFGTFDNTPISGSGTLRISSAAATAEFPAGDFGNFIRASGGIVEYYTTGTQDFTIPLSSASPTGLPLITYKNLVLSPATGRFIQMPNQDMQIYGTLMVQGASLTGIARLNSAAARILTVNTNIVVTGGTLSFQNTTAQTVDVDGSVTVGTGANFSVSNSGTAVTNLMFIDGNLSNNGVFDMANGTFLCNVTFSSTANTSITGTGTTTDFNLLTVSKGMNATPVLDVNATAFSLSGTGVPLVLSNGTFRLTSTQTVTIANGVDFNIPATARLSANGGTLELLGGNGIDLLLAGTVEVWGGAINVGTGLNDNSIEYAATGQPTITASGGTLSVRAQIRRASTSTQGGLIYNQSGTSVVAVGISSSLNTTRGVFEILNPGSSFTMSGGTLRVVKALGVTTIADLYLQPSASNVTGGTLEIGTGNTSQSIDINSIIPVYNVTVNGTTNTARLEGNGLTLRGSLTIGAGCVFDANNFNLNVAGDFINANTTSTGGINLGGFRAGSVSQTTTLNGSAGNQTIAGVSGNLTNFGNLVISNTFSGGTVTLQAAVTNIWVNGALILTTGIVSGTDNTITAMGTVSNSSAHTNTNITTGGITLANSASQLITGNGAGKFGNMTLNNGAGAVFGANQEITGRLTLTSGSLNINSHALVLSNTDLGAIAGATNTKYIITSGNLSDGGITKSFAANVTAGNFIYPIGVSGKYTPANYTITTGGLGGTITIRPVNSKHPNATGSGTAFIRYYWSVTSNVIVINALTHTYNYVVTDEAGTPANYRDARFKGGVWTVGISSTNPIGRVITFTNTDVQADYTAGELTAFENPITYTSVASGNWESDLSVWNIDPPGIGIGPPQGSFVIISDGHAVTITGDAKRVATVEIRGRLHVGVTNSHDFGVVSAGGIGQRTMQLQSSLFPAGDFSAFTGTSGGTVEYDGNVNLSSTQLTYNNLTFTSAGTKTLGNVDLTINGNFTILQGSVTNAVNNRTIFLASATGDFINNGVFTAGTGPIVVGRDLTNSGSGVIFNGPNGTSGLRVGRNLINSSSATFLAGTDSVGVRGTLDNSATFTANAGAIRVTGNLNNTSGFYTGGSGILNIKGSMTNNAAFSAGTGATTIGGSFGNSGGSAVYSANTNVMTITGGMTLSSSSTFNANAGSITINGNWSNSSTFNAGTGSVAFAGPAAQSLTGPTTFYNLSRANGGSLAISNNIDVSNLLSLSNGNLITGVNTVSLTNTATQPVLGYGTTAFVDGILAISYPNTALESRVYPVGKGSAYRPVTIQQTAPSTAPVVRVEMINTRPGGVAPVSVQTLSEARYYLIDQTSGTMNLPVIDLSFNTNGIQDETIVIAANTRVLRSTTSAGPWTDEGGTGVFTTFPAGHATSGVTSISNPTFFALGYQNSPTPITLQFFNAELKSDFVELTWATYSEHNNAYFTIERTKDLITFDSIGFVPGAGDSKMLIKYNDIDPAPLDGVSYYRLKQTDFDLRYSHSKVVRVVNSNPSRNGLTIYPNPSTLGSPLYMRMENQASKEAFVLITDVTGRVFFSGEVNFNEKVNLYDLKLISNLERGVYIINVSSNGRREIRKVIIF